MTRRPLSLLALCLAAGCAAAPAWEKPGADAATRDRDAAACRRETGSDDEAHRRDARIAAARGEIGANRGSGYDGARNDLDTSAERRRENRLLTACMRAKGYTSRS